MKALFSLGVVPGLQQSIALTYSVLKHTNNSVPTRGRHFLLLCHIHDPDVCFPLLPRHDNSYMSKQYRCPTSTQGTTDSVDSIAPASPRLVLPSHRSSFYTAARRDDAASLSLCVSLPLPSAQQNVTATPSSSIISPANASRPLDRPATNVVDKIVWREELLVTFTSWRALPCRGGGESIDVRERQGGGILLYFMIHFLKSVGCCSREFGHVWRSIFTRTYT